MRKGQSLAPAPAPNPRTSRRIPKESGRLTGLQTTAHLFSLRAMPQPPWTSPTGVRAVVDQWQASGAVKRCFTAERSLPPASPEYAPIPESLPAALRDALSRRGIESLYSHQVQAINAAQSGLIWAEPGMDLTAEVIQAFDGGAGTAAAPAPAAPAPAAAAPPAQK